MINSQEEIKKLCVENLKKLIQSIENDNNCKNYQYNIQLLEIITPRNSEIRRVSYSVVRDEISYEPNK